MIVLLYALAVVVATTFAQKTGARRLMLVVNLPLLVLDCLANCLIFQQSWRNTMSGEAWYHRGDPKPWRWAYRFVDALFCWQGPEHCRRQADKEKLHGGFWPALAHDWRTSTWLPR